VHCRKISVIAPWVCTPQNMVLGYDVGKISVGCLVLFAAFCDHITRLA